MSEINIETNSTEEISSETPVLDTFTSQMLKANNNTALSEKYSLLFAPNFEVINKDLFEPNGERIELGDKVSTVIYNELPMGISPKCKETIKRLKRVTFIDEKVGGEIAEIILVESYKEFNTNVSKSFICFCPIV